MAGKIIADTIETGAGADISTSYVVNGSAKAWVNFNGTGTVAIRESFSTSSITDNATGSYTVNFATAMTDANYVASGISSVDAITVTFITLGSTADQLSTSYKFASVATNGVAVDRTILNVEFLRQGKVTGGLA